jgi:hypothetical protein
MIDVVFTGQVKLDGPLPEDVVHAVQDEIGHHAGVLVIDVQEVVPVSGDVPDAVLAGTCECDLGECTCPPGSCEGAEEAR